MTGSVAAARGAYVPAGDYTLIVGGEPMAPDDGFDAVDPSVGSEWARMPQATEAHVDGPWPPRRGSIPGVASQHPGGTPGVRVADRRRIEAEPDRWARLLATENGRPIREAYSPTSRPAPGSCATSPAWRATTTATPIPVEPADSLTFYTTREPLGVIAALIPWNSPIITLANKIGPALAAGNTVVVKPSEFASASVLEFVARRSQEILPAGVLNVVTGFGPEVGAALVAHPGVAKITFTGGTATARRDHVRRGRRC